MCWVREDTCYTFVSFKIITPQYFFNVLYFPHTHAHTHMHTHTYTLITTHSDILLYIIMHTDTDMHYFLVTKYILNKLPFFQTYEGTKLVDTSIMLFGVEEV